MNENQRIGGALFPEDPLWYKDAIIYELHVRAFADSDGDGIGDFQGLISKLDYLEDLGVTAIWLLPFYPSPLKDDGYDISDYLGIHPAYGTMADFREFLSQSHRRGIRVITELVINHTSDQHPWFQRARRSPPGSQWRDFYVWSDTPEKYREARVIFKDFEHSNWAMDPVAGAYYWHRFYSHQPDLNYDNPAVHRAIFRIVDFWLKQGVDGLRIDAVPYLYERDGTNCENLPETHAFIRDLRKHVDERFKNRMLLAEANQWLEDAVAYFGNNDEFHMAFHFPLMPRMFMAIRMEDRFPIVDILQQTPPIPEPCQWALFLRNHDELTLEMVTDEERDYMYRMYAQDAVARINLGIRRRLAPLLNNDRGKIELMTALLFSLPGTPVWYYGDEIGMGDNFYLGDRNGVRTPMQWSPDRNAGFSRANPQRLYLPPIIDPEYHYEAINVENQEKNPDSLLWQIKRMIAMRKRFKAFGRGSIEFLPAANRRVLAFLRRYQKETILAVFNLSRHAQQACFNLSAFRGMVPVELFGHEAFTPIGDEDYPFVLGPHGFYWFSLSPPRTGSLRMRALPAETIAEPPILDSDAETIFDPENRPALARILAEYIPGRRWFRAKGREISTAEVQEIVPLPMGPASAHSVLLRVSYTTGEPETYNIPVGIATGEKAIAIRSQYPGALIARLGPCSEDPKSQTYIYDAMVDRAFCDALLEAISRGKRFTGEKGIIAACRSAVFKEARGPAKEILESKPVTAEQTNSSVLYGNRLILKLYRSPEEGINPDVEIGRFLTEKMTFFNIAPVAGWIEYRKRKGMTMTLALLQGYIPNEGDAWSYTLDRLARYFQYVQTHPTVQVPPLPPRSPIALPKEIPSLAQETIGEYLLSAELIGKRTAQLHLALAGDSSDPEFAPEPFTIQYQTGLYHSMRSFTTRALQSLGALKEGFPNEIQPYIEGVLKLEREIIGRFALLRARPIPAHRIRCHGDYHLGQLLFTGKDFFVIDFEGEPARPLSERRLKRCPLRDVAGMLRSFDYAVQTALHHRVPAAFPPQALPALEQWGKYWRLWVSSVFLKAYLEEMRGTRLFPEDPQNLKMLLDAYLLEKAMYEIVYEVNNRPEWLIVPLKGVLSLMEDVQSPLQDKSGEVQPA